MMSEAKLKATKRTGLKILARKQLLKKLTIAHVQVKAGNNSEIFRQIVCSLYQSKKITKKVYNNIIKSLQ